MEKIYGRQHFLSKRSICKICFVKIKSYYDNIKFACEIEVDGKTPFIDVHIIRKETRVEITVYQKSTNNDIFLH